MKREFVYVLALLGLVLPALALAVDAEDHVVKVESFLCAKPDDLATIRRGSGVLVERNGHYFAVTSGHVPYQTRSALAEYCYRISSRRIGTHPAKLRAALFLKDLALLEIADEKRALDLKSSALSWSGLASHYAIKNGEGVQMLGYPFSVSGDFVASGWLGNVLNERSSQTALQLDSVIEIQGPSQYGMSGGGLFSKTGQWLGLLSHHQLRVRVGEPTSWWTRSEKDVGNDSSWVTLAIPVEAIVAWWDAVAHGDTASDIRLDSAADATHLSLTLGTIHFEEINCATPAPSTPGGPIGGGHGVGHRTVRPIGGGTPDSVSLPADAPCQIRLTLGVAGNPWPFDKAFEKVLLGELQKQSPQFLNWVKRGSLTLQTDSLLSALRLLAAGFQPVVSPKPPEDTEAHPDDIAAQGRLTHEKIEAWVQSNKEKFIHIGQGIDAAPDEELVRKWNASDAIDRMWLYWIAKDFTHQTAKRWRMLRLANLFVQEAATKWLQEVRVGDSLPAWQKRDEGERMWIMGTSYYLYDNWSRVDAATQRVMWNELDVTGRALLVESLLMHYKQHAELGEMETLADAFDQQWRNWWNVAGDHRAAFSQCNAAQRWWLFHAVQNDRSAQDEVRRLNGGGNFSLLARFPAVEMPTDR